MSDARDDVLGVEREVLEAFLTLFRNCYREVDLATFFLERSEGISNGQGFLNVRDAMSHFVTALDSATPAGKKAAQLPNCEEHFRRAILEPYETAVYTRVEKLDHLIDAYKQEVVPVARYYQDLRDAPSDGEIEAARMAIRDRARKGRAAKGKNLWNDEWREGVEAFTQAYEQARALFHELERYLNLRRATRQREEDAHRGRRDRLIGIIGAIIGLIGIAATFYTWVLK